MKNYKTAKERRADYAAHQRMLRRERKKHEDWKRRVKIDAMFLEARARRQALPAASVPHDHFLDLLPEPSTALEVVDSNILEGEIVSSTRSTRKNGDL
jgi:hypothetical protein